MYLTLYKIYAIYELEKRSLFHNILPMVKPMKLGLVVGGFVSLLHLIRALAIAIMPYAMQDFLNRIFSLHFLEPVYVLTPATRGK